MLNKFLYVVAAAISITALLAFTGLFRPKKYDVEIIRVVSTSVNDESPTWSAFTHITNELHGKKKPTTVWIQLPDDMFRMKLDSLLANGPIICPIEKDDVFEITQKDLKMAIFKQSLSALADVAEGS